MVVVVIVVVVVSSSSLPDRTSFSLPAVAVAGMTVKCPGPFETPLVMGAGLLERKVPANACTGRFVFMLKLSALSCEAFLEPPSRGAQDGGVEKVGGELSPPLSSK